MSNVNDKIANFLFSGCGGTYDNSQGTITSPNYPGYFRQNQYCFYNIIAPLNSTITFTFTSFQMQGCGCCGSSCYCDWLQVTVNSNLTS